MLYGRTPGRTSHLNRQGIRRQTRIPSIHTPQATRNDTLPMGAIVVLIHAGICSEPAPPYILLNLQTIQTLIHATDELPT